jgi:hypothetical protein
MQSARVQYGHGRGLPRNPKVVFRHGAIVVHCTVEQLAQVQEQIVGVAAGAATREGVSDSVKVGPVGWTPYCLASEIRECAEQLRVQIALGVGTQ